MAISLERARALNTTSLTAAALERMKPGQILTDAKNPGFRARRQGSGAPVLEVRYRHDGQRRTVKLGSYRRHPEDDEPKAAAGKFLRAVSPKAPKTVRDALERYHALLDTMERGLDPKAEAAAEKVQDERRLEPALERYGKDLDKRGVVKAAEVKSLLKRELLGELGNVPLASIERATIVDLIEKVEAAGFPGKAKELRTRTGVLLSWCVDRGLLHANPMAGWRMPRKTRAQRLVRPGRSLEKPELPIMIRTACTLALEKGARGDLGVYLLLRLLCGQRRSETVAFAWDDINWAAGVWTIREEVGKVKPHVVPLPRLALFILRAHRARQERERRLGKRVLFPHVEDPANIGWSKLLRRVYKATADAGMAPWEPGDLRKTFRTLLEDELGVPEKVCELMISHGPKDELVRIYSRAERWQERKVAARRWALYLLKVRRAG